MARQTRNARVQAFVDLLDRPLILAAEDREAFARIVRAETELRDWFRVYPGWHIERTREMVRLVRQPATMRPLLGLPGLRGKLDYVLLALVLHQSEVSAARGGPAGTIGNRFLLSLLADEITTRMKERYGPEAFDLADQSQRRALVRVMQALERLGALTRLDGSASEWAEGSASGDGLYAFTEIAASLVAVRPSQPFVAAAAQPLEIAASGASFALPSDNRADAEQRAWRALLIGPALFAVDDQEAFRALTQKRVAMARDITEYFGWWLDVRRTMARIVRDSHAQDTGSVMLSPRLRSEYGPALLLCNAVRDLVSRGELTVDAGDGVLLPLSRFRDLLLTIRVEHRTRLTGGLADCSAEELIERVAGLMRENGMLRGPDARQEVWLSPLSALYRGYFQEEAPSPGEEDDRDAQLQLFA
ncbi:MAG: TIGR02678 family protein [Chloroflexota bacterium]